MRTSRKSDSSDSTGWQPIVRNPVSGKTRRAGAVALLAILPGVACYPVDTGSNAAALALMEVDAALYSMRDETSILQSQIDSLDLRIKKLDSLIRWLANLSGNPIQDAPPAYIPPE